jgi:hypothetical protein
MKKERRSFDKTRFLSATGFIIIILLVTTVFPVGFVFAQSGYWDIAMRYNVNATENESGAAISISMSGNSVLHLTVVDQQVSGSGNGNYAVSIHGNFNSEGSFGTISAPQVNFAEMASVSGTVSSDGTAALVVTVTMTNAPSTVSGTMTTTVAGQTVTTPINIPISSITQTTSGTYQVKLQNEYTVTTPISASGVQGSTSISVTRTVNPSPTASPLETSPTPSVSSTPTTSATSSPTETYTWGTVGLLRGSAAFMDPNTGQYVSMTTDRGVTSGNIIKTTSNDALMQFSYPDGKGVVDFGSNSEFQFVGIQQQTSTDGTLKLDATVPPLTNTYTGPYEEGLIDEGLGPLGIFLGGALHGLRGVVVDGILYLIEGIGHFKGHSANTENVEPVAVSQGYLIPMGTEYTVNSSSQGTTINVITGPLVFLDWRTGNTVTLESGQSLTLQNSGQSGFTSQQLQSNVSNLDTASVNQWWVTSNPAGQFRLLIIVVSVVIAVIAVLAVALGRKSRRKAQGQQMPIPPPPPPPSF